MMDLQTTNRSRLLWGVFQVLCQSFAGLSGYGPILTWAMLMIGVVLAAFEYVKSVSGVTTHYGSTAAAFLSRQDSRLERDQGQEGASSVFWMILQARRPRVELDVRTSKWRHVNSNHTRSVAFPCGDS